MLPFLPAIPFFGLLFSIAFLPLWAPKIWARHYGMVSLFWSLTTVIPACFQCTGGIGSVCISAIIAPLFEHFLPFVLLLSALYVVTGGMALQVGFRGTPLANTVFLGVFSLISSIFGTTGAAMLGIRPLIDMNKHRSYKTHTLVFFIFLVCNIGGALSAIGDPPLFLGFLKGIPFFWPTLHLLPHFLIIEGSLLLLYFGIDTFWLRREKQSLMQNKPLSSPWLSFKGKKQLVLAGLLIASLIVTGQFSLGEWVWGKIHLSLSDMIRNLFLILLMGISFYFKPYAARVREKWHLHPLIEIAILFCGIFITAEPLLHLLQEGTNGPFGPFLSFILKESPVQALAYFWTTGILSSFLDNAPTYLIFFSLAGGDPALFLNSLQTILLAISAGSVFMGALTYIGNAPNLLVKTIAEEEYRIPMPSFFGYIFWACVILLPVLSLWSWWCFGS